MDLLHNSRYKDAPVYIFFENYVLDVIGKLPMEKHDVLQGLELQRVFGTQASNWKEVIRETLQLSSTIDIAILHQWYLAQEKAEENGSEVNASQFSKEFVDLYFAEDSTVDVWNQETLADAKQLIQKHQAQQNALS